MGTRTATRVHSYVKDDIYSKHHIDLFGTIIPRSVPSLASKKGNMCSRNAQLGLFLHGGSAKRPAELVLFPGRNECAVNKEQCSGLFCLHLSCHRKTTGNESALQVSIQWSPL